MLLHLKFPKLKLNVFYPYFLSGFKTTEYSGYDLPASATPGNSPLQLRQSQGLATLVKISPST